MLSRAIINAKDKSVVSLWWLSIPYYILASLFMKSIITHSTLITYIKVLTERERIATSTYLAILPIALIIFNFISLRKIYFLSDRPKTLDFLQTHWYNVLIIIFSFLILIIYALSIIAK